MILMMQHYLYLYRYLSLLIALGAKLTLFQPRESRFRPGKNYSALIGY
jgi:hypothetical protein